MQLLSSGRLPYEEVFPCAVLSLSDLGYRALMRTARGFQIKKARGQPHCINVGFYVEVGKGGDWKFQKRRCKSQRRGLPVICDGWNPQVSVLTSRSTSIPVVGPFLKIQPREAGCRDVPRCDDPLPGPTIGWLHAEEGCGDVSLCDDPPPGPMRANQNGETGCGHGDPPGPIAENSWRGEARRGEVPQCDETPPGPGGRCSKDLGFNKDSVRVNAAVRKRALNVRIRTAREEDELKIVERAILVSDAVAGC